MGATEFKKTALFQFAHKFFGANDETVMGGLSDFSFFVPGFCIKTDSSSVNVCNCYLTSDFLTDSSGFDVLNIYFNPDGIGVCFQ